MLVTYRKEKAERVGFEPTVELPPLQFSRLACSAAPAPLRKTDFYCTTCRRRRASHPGAFLRLTSVSEPPCASAICRLSTRPMPEPPGFVVKNGTNRLVVLARPGPSSSIQTSTCPGAAVHPVITCPWVSIAASTALRIKLIINCSI